MDLCKYRNPAEVVRHGGALPVAEDPVRTLFAFRQMLNALFLLTHNYAPPFGSAFTGRRSKVGVACIRF